jgi:hypothetical protein
VEHDAVEHLFEYTFRSVEPLCFSADFISTSSANVFCANQAALSV